MNTDILILILMILSILLGMVFCIIGGYYLEHEGVGINGKFMSAWIFGVILIGVPVGIFIFNQYNMKKYHIEEFISTINDVEVTEQNDKITKIVWSDKNGNQYTYYANEEE